LREIQFVAPRVLHIGQGRSSGADRLVAADQSGSQVAAPSEIDARGDDDGIGRSSSDSSRQAHLFVCVVDRGVFRPSPSVKAVRVELFDDQIDSISLFDPLTGAISRKVPRFTVYPGTIT